MVSTTLVVGDRSYQLRYTYKQLKEIRDNASKRFLGKDEKFLDPLEILKYIGNDDIQIFLLEKGLEWPQSGYDKINFEKAADLRQDYLEQGELDAGEKYDAFGMLLIEAIAANSRGADSKKLLERIAAEKKQIREAELARIYKAKAEFEAGTKPNETPPSSA